MLSGEKILITGASSPVAEVLAAALAKDNEVWGAARFTDKSAPERLAKSNVKTVTVDLAESSNLCVGYLESIRFSGSADLRSSLVTGQRWQDANLAKEPVLNGAIAVVTEKFQNRQEHSHDA